MSIKHTKWDQNWQSRVKAFSKNLDDIKNKQVGVLLEAGNALQTEKTELTKEIRKLKLEQKGLSQIFLYHRQANKELDRLNDATNKATHNPREKNFLGAGAGTKYQTNGWLKQAGNHFKPASGKLDNLYKVKTASGEVETTEEQVIQTIARVVKAFQKVDADDFEAKYNAKETDTVKQAQVKTYLKEIQDQATEIIVGSSKDAEGNSKQPSYDFSHNFHKGKFDDNGTWQPEATDYNQPPFDYQHFFDFISLVHEQPFLSDLDKDKQKNIDKNEHWQIFLKGEKWEAEQLKDYGITIDSAKTILYKTSETDKQTISGANGISGWLDLAHSISQNANNQTKLTTAFTNSPTQQLLSDLNGWNQGADGFLTDGTNWTLPESADDMEVLLAEMEAKKISNATEQGLLAKQISEKNETLKTKDIELKQKETELNTLIKEIVEKKRTKLKDYKISDGFANQHKRTVSELIEISQILENIRYLENDGDSTLPSSESVENTANQQIDDLFNKTSPMSQNYLIESFKNLAYKGAEEKLDLNQAIERIKAGKYTDLNGKEQEVYWNLTDFYKHFEAKEKLVKLSEWENQAQTALKVAIDKKDEAEKLPEWQAKLKALDPLITETIFTKEKMEDFQKHTNFKNIHGVESLLKKVMGDDKKVKADFIEKLKKENAEATDLGKMITKLSAEKIIKLIHLFEYEKETEDKQKEKRRKYSWERSKKVSGKYVGENEDYTLPETEQEDFQKFLYQLATGQKSLSSISKPTEQNSPTEEKKHFAKYWGWYAAGGALTTAIGLIIYFWEKIKTLWEPKEEEDNE